MTRSLVVRAHHLVCLLHDATFSGTHPTLPGLLAALREDPDRRSPGPTISARPVPTGTGRNAPARRGWSPGTAVEYTAIWSREAANVKDRPALMIVYEPK